MAAAALMLASCSDSTEVRDAKGGYHYKTSGQVSITDNGKTTQQQLDQETGLMEVISLHSGDSLLLTFSQTGGEVYETKGIADGKTVRFDPLHRTITLRTTTENTISTNLVDSLGTYTTVQHETFDLSVSGYAEVYDNTLIFHYTYDGQAESGKTLHGEDITMLAKRN